MNPTDTSRRIRFGPYEADFHTQELRKLGIRVKVSGQPLQILEILLARPGQLVSRAELQQRLWPGQVFVDSTHGLNAAVNKLRDALNDSASEPKYIETLPRRGYRFIGSLEMDLPQPVMTREESPRAHEAVPPDSIEKAETLGPEIPVSSISQHGARRWILLSAVATLAFCVIGLMVVANRRPARNESLEEQQRKVKQERYAASRRGNPQASPAEPAIALPSSSNADAAPEFQEKSAEKVLRLRSTAAGRSLVMEDQNTSDADDGHAQPNPKLHPLIWGESGNAAPQFSPDGKRIVFMSNRNGPWQIWVCDADGSHPRQVSFTESAGTPRWSPDGRSIAFDAPFDGSTWIFVVHVDQSEQTRPIVEGLVPSFSRDGKWIYFASDRTGDWQVWKTSVRDGSEVQVTHKGGFAALESTDGYVYYSKSRYSQPEICRVGIEGEEESCGFQHLRPRTWASWAPTREGIVFAEDLPDGEAELSVYDPARRQVRDLVTLESAPFWVGASVDGKRAIMNDAAERQISMVENLP